MDIAPLVAGDSIDSVAEEIGRASRGIGFFYITGHGIPDAITRRMFDDARRFFAAPADTKQAVSIKQSPHNRGYVALGDEILDPDTPADIKECFNIGLELAEDDPELLAGMPFRGLNLWPELPGWRENMLDYFDRCWDVGLALHRAFAVDLGLPQDHFTPMFDRPMATLRLLHYPPRPETTEPGQLGAGTHTDYGNVTILAVDGVAGLQVRNRDGDWIDAPCIDGAFVCNIGDCLMRWSNDVYASTPHRVRNADTQERYSAAFFLDPNPDATVECLPTCVTDDRPARYEPVSGAAYLTSRLDATYAHRGNAD
ncbi:MAG: isopenicillin N synthase family oxygenase [Alphaproteobacteria bacterium]|nr:isopenicillin N synthase family oxygenase [Alphaproteobacteria bacterium]